MTPPARNATYSYVSVDRFKSYLPIIIAVLIRAYKMSQSVGWAMESRGLNLNRNGVRRTYRVQPDDETLPTGSSSRSPSPRPQAASG